LEFNKTINSSVALKKDNEIVYEFSPTEYHEISSIFCYTNDIHIGENIDVYVGNNKVSTIAVNNLQMFLDINLE
jgi:hypothetical protein